MRPGGRDVRLPAHTGYVRYQTDRARLQRHDAPQETRIPAPKPIQLILARQLASSLAVPILLVDTEGTLVFYNEPAELILDQRFEETGEMRADAWSKIFAMEDEFRMPIAQEDRPTMLALSERRPFSRTVWMRCGHREWWHVNITAFPLIGEGSQFLGAQMIFWEA
jgi:PAS domain-containing protein